MNYAVTIKPADLPVSWQGISGHTTQRGRVKAVLTGIPGPLFWHQYKHGPDFKAKLREASVTLQRLAKNNWQVVLWINRHNAALVESLGFTVPEKPADEPAPF